VSGGAGAGAASIAVTGERGAEAGYGGRADMGSARPLGDLNTHTLVADGCLSAMRNIRMTPRGGTLMFVVKHERSRLRGPNF
jgi:hypothetical protein